MGCEGEAADETVPCESDAHAVGHGDAGRGRCVCGPLCGRASRCRGGQATVAGRLCAAPAGGQPERLFRRGSGRPGAASSYRGVGRRARIAEGLGHRRGQHGGVPHPVDSRLLARFERVVRGPPAHRRRDLCGRGRNGVGSRFRATIYHMGSGSAENDSRPLPHDSTKKYLDAVWYRLADSTDDASLPDDPLARACTYLDFHLHEPVRLRFLAQYVAKTNPGHLARLFRQRHRSSFTGYLRELRMQKGADLLRRTHLPIQRIAARVGYGDPSRFATHFRRRFGLAPREFRGEFGSPQPSRKYRWLWE